MLANPLLSNSTLSDPVASSLVSGKPIENTPPDFRAMALAEPLLKGLKACGFTQPTEIQSRSIPSALEGRDIMASAQTGTGKTAAFVLPALQRLLTTAKTPGRGPRVLILTPTRELAGQVEQVVRQLIRFTPLTAGVIVGGLSFGPQERLLRKPLDLLVATPGRLLDHMSSGGVDFSRLEILVLDEADRMLDMGFVKPVTKIAAALPATRQTLLFSATLEGEVNRISARLLRNPVRIQLASAKVRHEGIQQHMHVAESPEHKHSLLSHLLENPALTQAIVFTATKRGADKLAQRLKDDGHNTAALHGNMRQGARQRTVDLLRQGRVRVLVATDVAARGIDVVGISHVINFDMPMVAEDYIHRIGRTGRNGAFGTAISLVGRQDRVKLGMIERLTGRRLEPLNLQVQMRPARPRPAAQSEAPEESQGVARPARRQGARPARKPSGNTPAQPAGQRAFRPGSRPKSRSGSRPAGRSTW